MWNNVYALLLKLTPYCLPFKKKKMKSLLEQKLCVKQLLREIRETINCTSLWWYENLDDGGNLWLSLYFFLVKNVPNWREKSIWTNPQTEVWATSKRPQALVGLSRGVRWHQLLHDQQLGEVGVFLQCNYLLHLKPCICNNWYLEDLLTVWLLATPL